MELLIFVICCDMQLSAVTVELESRKAVYATTFFLGHHVHVMKVIPSQFWLILHNSTAVWIFLSMYKIVGPHFWIFVNSVSDLCYYLKSTHIHEMKGYKCCPVKVFLDMFAHCWMSWNVDVCLKSHRLWNYILSLPKIVLSLLNDTVLPTNNSY